MAGGAAMATAALLPPSGTSRMTTYASPWMRNDLKNRVAVSSSPTPEIRRGVARVRAFYNPLEDPIFKEALKEPVAFMGGMFAGLLRLDLKEEPLKEWITRTVEAAGITEEELGAELKQNEDAPQQIEIE